MLPLSISADSNFSAKLGLWVYHGGMSTLGQGFVIGRSTGRCAVSDHQLEPGEPCIAVLARPLPGEVVEKKGKRAGKAGTAVAKQGPGKARRERAVAFKDFEKKIKGNSPWKQKRTC